MKYSFYRFFIAFVLSISIYGCSIFSSHYISNSTEPLKIYSFEDNTKRELNSAIQCLFEEEPKYKVPSSFNAIHNYSDLSTPESRKWNSDTVNFHFFINSQGEEIIYWTRFVGHEQNWDTTKYRYGIACELSLKAIYVDKVTITAKDLKRIENAEGNNYIKLFESEILSKLDTLLISDCK